MGSDYKAPNVGRQTRESINAIANNAPRAIRSLGAATRAEAPANAALDWSQYQQYAPLYLQQGEELANQQAQAATQRDLSVINNGGRQLSQEALALDRSANPEWYNNRAIASAGFGALIGGQDPNRLTGSETANVERGINRMNYNAGNPTNIGDATTTTSNAMLFGDALQNKRNAFAQSLSLFPGMQQGSQSGIDAYQIASGRGASSGTNASLGRYNGPQQSDANAIGQGVMGGAFGIQNQRQDLMANRRQGIDYMTQTLGSLPSCCFIFMEAYNGKLPWSVRVCRDFHYTQDIRLSRGYKKMAKWLVPLMQKSRVVKWLVNTLMVKPITRHGEWLTGEVDVHYSKTCHWIRNGWFNIWKNYANT